jgi:molybdate transport system permease protein
MSAHRTPHRTPIAFVALAAFTVVAFTLPIVALFVRVPWSEVPDLLTSEVVVEALRLSVISSLAATAIAIVLGVPLAWVLARATFPGKSVVRGLVTLPLVLPPVVAGAALLFALGRSGVIGEPLYEATGVALPFSLWAVIIANTFVAMPFLVITLEGALANLDPRFEAAASTLGASRWTVIRRVALPMVRPSLMAGVVLTWARAFGEFGATVTFAGSLAGRTQTMPLTVFVALQADREAAIAVSLVMVVVSLVVLIALRGRWWRTA